MNFFWRAWRADQISAVFDGEDDGKKGVKVSIGGHHVGFAFGVTAIEAKSDINEILAQQYQAAAEEHRALARIDEIKSDLKKLEARKRVLESKVFASENVAEPMARVIAAMLPMLRKERQYVIQAEREAIIAELRSLGLWETPDAEKEGQK